MLKMALCVFPVIDELASAFRQLEVYIEAAGRAKCDLLVFPEAALGGLEIGDDFQADLLKCLPVNSARIRALRESARQHRMGIGLGFLERVGGRIFDSYLLLDPDGGIALNYRRISRGWLPLEADPDRYRCGTSAGFAQTELGSLGILVCGDLFEEGIAGSLAESKPDLILHVMARAYPYSGNIQQDWDTREFPHYLAEYAKLGAPVAVVNSVELQNREGSINCGGAWLIRDAEILWAQELLSPGLLCVTLQDLYRRPSQ